MKRTSMRFQAAIFALSASLLIWTLPAARAQSPGYVTGYAGVQPFDPTNATLLGFLHVPDAGMVSAVSADGSALYVPLLNRSNGKGAMVLGTVSTSNGQVLSKVHGIGYAPTFVSKVVLSPDGATAYAMCDDNNKGPSLVGIVDLGSQSLVGYIYANGGMLADIALSPDGQRLFVSAAPSGFGAPGRITRPQTNLPVYDCDGGSTICVFNASTFALENQVAGLFGNLSLSRDGSTLYVVTTLSQQALYAVSTSTFSQTQIPLPGFFPRVVVVAPSGTQAVAVGSTTTSTFGELLIDTKTNTVVGTFPTPPVPTGSEAGTGTNISAFSRDGSSLWTVLCTGVSCTETILGQSFPSGNLIGEATLPRGQFFNSVSF
jgi:hypothetical protein